MITKKRIQNVKPYLARLKRGERFHVAFRLGSDAQAALTRAGFPPNAPSGSTVLPARVGPVSTFNAEGRWLVRKDLPKETRFIRTILWSWQEWRGRDTIERSEERDIYQECYQREWVPAPAIELTFVVVGERSWVVTPLFENFAERYDDIRHAINLVLELFGTCEFIDEKKDVFAGVVVKRANWQFLPPGETPWATYLDELRKDLFGGDPRASDSASIVIDRQDTIKRFGPEEIFVGNAGFRDYLAYVFKSRGVVVLESIRHGNAIYMFGLDWEVVSQLSKAEIISGGLAKARIIHSTGWKGRLQLALPSPKKGAA